MEHFHSHRISRRNGSVSVVMALSVSMLLGCCALAVDYGLLVADANRLQRACDAAAIAGANKLKVTGVDVTDEYNAKVDAQRVAAQNGVSVNFDDITVTNGMTVRVPASTTRSFSFARTMGQNSGSITRSATAGRVALAGVFGAVPLAITTNDYYTYKNGSSFEVLLVRNQDTDFVPGTVASVDLRPDGSGKSGAVFEEDLTYGYQGTIFIDQKIDNALTADTMSQGMKLESAIKQRFADAAAAPYADTGTNYTWPNYPDGDRRIVQLIVADPNPAANNNPLLVARFFVPVYIESYRSPGNKGLYVRIRIVPTYTMNSDHPGIVLGNANTLFTGPSTVTLQQ